MRKKDAKIIRNLRMGIPATVSSGLPQTSRIAEKQADAPLPANARAYSRLQKKQQAVSLPFAIPRFPFPGC